MKTAPDPVELAQNLIRFPSVTPADGGALSYLGGLLAGAGFIVEQPVFEDSDTPSIENLYATIGKGAPCLVFAGHTDVVPPGNAESWSHSPFSGKVIDGYLWGRGAEDMKGGVAASVAAVLGYIGQHGVPQTGSIAFLITGDEEGPAINGTVKLLKWAAEQGAIFSHCVLGEPTNPEQLGDMIKTGRRGSLSGEILVRGKQGHAAYPKLAANPIPLMARLILALKAAPYDAGNADFAPSNLEVTTMDVGNPAGNVIPSEARASFNIRFNNLWTPETLEVEIRSRLVDVTEEGITCDLHFKPTNAVAFLTKPGPFIDLVREAITTETGKVPAISTSGGTSDARFIKDYCDVVEFGLVGKTMHQVNERTPVEDILALTRIYQRVIEGYFERF